MIVDQWYVVSVRLRPSDSTLDLYINNTRAARTNVTNINSTIANWSTYNSCYISNAVAGGLFDIAAFGVWDTALSSHRMTLDVRDWWLQGPTSTFVKGTTHITGSIEGGLQIKSTNTYTQTVQRYPPISLSDTDRSEIIDMTYGNGSYSVVASGTPSSIDVFSGSNVPRTGWIGTSNAYDSTLGTYLGTDTTTAFYNPTASSNTTIAGEWIQMKIPDDIIPYRYSMTPMYSNGLAVVGSPTAWTFAASTDGLFWTILDQKSNISWASVASNNFAATATTTAYSWYRWIVTKTDPTFNDPFAPQGILRLSSLFVDGSSRDVLSCHDNRVIVLDRIGVGTHSPTAPLHVTGLSILSGLQIVPRTQDPAWTSNTSSVGPWVPSAPNVNNIVYTGGNVGIGTTTPLFTLDVTGNGRVTGSFSKSSGTFDISHPLDVNKRLVHSFIEGPRCDLIYRGTVSLSNGRAKASLDKDCVDTPDCAMTDGTFKALCKNPQIFLQNMTSFNRVIGNIEDSTLNVICEDHSNNGDVISWMIVAERKDEFIKSWDMTNVSGSLVTEYLKTD